MMAISSIFYHTYRWQFHFSEEKFRFIKAPLAAPRKSENFLTLSVLEGDYFCKTE